MSRINLGDYRFFLGGCKIFGLFLCVFWVGFVGFDICDFLGIGFRPRGELLSFTRVKESNQRKHAPIKSLFFALFQFSLRQFCNSRQSRSDRAKLPKN